MKLLGSVLRSFGCKTSFQRFCNSAKVDVRVRFAPSPTGLLHLGGLRTALYNYVFAKKNGGKFILRIEDTDQKRIKAGSVENLESMLQWTGIIPDESPRSGGPCAPYFQSLRLDKYKEIAYHLLETRDAYRCFCSETRLELTRKEALRNRQNPGYDNKCRHLTPSEIEEYLAKKQPFTIRFKITKGPMTFNDLIYGPYTLNISDYEGDFIILKSDGFPTYHLASVLDDHFMAISHVLRGAEWLSSTTKHLMLNKALNWQPPTFAHLPLLVNSDRTKLSKRQESLGVEYFKNQGCEPLALVNFLSSIGSGFGMQSSCDVIELQDLCMKFNISEVNTNSCVLDLSKLDVFNHNYLVKQLSNELSTNALIGNLRGLLRQQLGARYEQEAQHFSDTYVKKILLCYKDRISNLSELVQPEMKYLWTLPETDEILSEFRDIKISSTDAVVPLKKITTWLPETSDSDFVQSKLGPTLKEFFKGERLKFGVIMRMLRIVLTGQKDGPGIAEILDILGKEESLRKLNTALHNLEKLQAFSRE